MNWETVTSSLGYRAYALWNNGRKLLTLAFRPGSTVAKIEYGNEKRAFSLSYEGIFRNRMVMRNEYGVRLAQISADGNEPLISLDDEKLFYSISDDREPKVTVYKDSIEVPLAECSINLPAEKGTTSRARNSATTQSLLLALCWYLFSPVAKEQHRQLV